MDLTVSFPCITSESSTYAHARLHEEYSIVQFFFRERPSFCMHGWLKLVIMPVGPTPVEHIPWSPIKKKIAACTWILSPPQVLAITLRHLPVLRLSHRKNPGPARFARRLHGHLCNFLFVLVCMHSPTTTVFLDGGSIG